MPGRKRVGQLDSGRYAVSCTKPVGAGMRSPIDLRPMKETPQWLQETALEIAGRM